MKFPMVDRRKADNTANAILLILLGILFFTGEWWPWILFAIGANIAIRQFMASRKSDFLITLSILAIILLFTFFEMTSSIIIGLLFMAGGIYMIMKEYFFHDEIKIVNQRNSQDKNSADGRKEK